MTPTYLLDLAQGTIQVGEVLGAKRLDTRLVVAVKRRDGARAARFLGLLWLGEPHPHMEGVHREELRAVRARVGDALTTSA